MTDWQDIRQAVGHRPYPMPASPFTMTMSWHDVLFAHWRVDVDALRRAVPDSLDLDLWRGEAWIGVLPFYMTQVGVPAVNQLPWLSAFEELNVRTYVTHGGRPGIYFFSLDAANWLAVLGARAGFRLPYFWARMGRERHGAAIHYRSRRLIGPPARFEARYQPTGEPYHAFAGSFEHWATERYALYTVDRHGQPYRGDIQHKPWRLQDARAELDTVEMTHVQRIELSGQPTLHFARRQDVLAWPLQLASERPEEKRVAIPKPMAPVAVDLVCPRVDVGEGS